MNSLIEFWENTRPADKGYVNPSVLYEFWENIDDKEGNKVKAENEEAKQNIDNYFYDKFEIMVSGFTFKYGYRSYDPKLVIDWFVTVPEEVRAKNGVNYNIPTITPSFEEFCKKRRQENKEFEQKMKEEQAKQEKEAKEKLRDIAIKKEI